MSGSPPEPLSPLQRAAVALRELRARLDRLEAERREPIAIVGIGCRFPGTADSPASFWRLLRDGRAAIGEYPRTRWDVGRFYDPDPDRPGRIYARAGSFLESVDGFDAAFFGMPSREADSLDPQQRLLLEVAWEALEDAGVPPDTLRETQTGVFVGMGQNDYARRRLLSGDVDAIGPFDGTGNGFCFAAGRLSYLLGLQGPNLAVDTACSASLVAAHLACQSLRNRECELAIAGGVHLVLSPEVSVFLSRARALSPDGYCRTFDAAASGYGRGEGCGIVVLKRLSDAVKDGDRIAAVIRGSAINHDGPSSGLTVPSAPAQQKLIREALDRAGLQPGDIDYLEAHGTATPLGDPIEIGALRSVFGERPADAPLRLGSVKTNIGHLEAAAGIAGLIKVALSLQHGELAPHLHFTTGNPAVPWQELPFRVVTRLEPWAPGPRPRRAGVSSFGISGTNVHVVLEEAPATAAGGESTADGRDDELVILRLAARSGPALNATASRYAEHIRAHPEQQLRDVCYSANTGRAEGIERAAVVVHGREALVAALARLARGDPGPGIFRGRGTDRPRTRFAAADVSAETMAFWRSRGVSPHPATSPARAADHVLDSGPASPCELLERAAALYVSGAPLNWHAFADDGCRRVALPTYPWQRERHWLDWLEWPAAPSAAVDGTAVPLLHPLVHRRVTSPVLRAELEFATVLSADLPLIAEHRVGDRPVVPAAAYAEMAFAAARAAGHGELTTIEQCAFAAPLVLDNPAIDVRIVLRPSAEGAFEFEIFSSREAVGRVPRQFAPADPNEEDIGMVGRVPRGSAAADPAGPLRPSTMLGAALSEVEGRGTRPARLGDGSGAWTSHASGRLTVSAVAEPPAMDLDALSAAMPDTVVVETVIRALQDSGVNLRGCFRVLDDIRRGTDMVLARLTRGADAGWIVDPALLDGCTALHAALHAPTSDCLVQARTRRITVWGSLRDARWALLRRTGAFTGDLTVLDRAGRVVCAIEGQELRRADVRRADTRLRFYELAWIPSAITTEPPVDDEADRAYAAAEQALEAVSAHFAAEAVAALADETIDRQHSRLLARLRDIAATRDPSLSESAIPESAIPESPIPESAIPESALSRASRIAAQHPIARVEFELLTRCGSRLADVVRGSCEPLALLFPEHGGVSARELYASSHVAQVMNQRLVAAVKSRLAAMPRGRAVRVLEVGAGSGATTDVLLDWLPPDAEYWFTDISGALLQQARMRLADRRGLRFATFDLESPPGRQGIPEATFDLVIASNVLHATRDLRTSLRHVRQALRTDGALLLLEGTKPLGWVDVIFGLTDGWWRFADAARSSHPLVPVSTWRALFEETGFAASTVASDPDRDGVAGQAVLVASTSATSSRQWLVCGDDDLARQMAAGLAARGERSAVAAASSVPVAPAVAIGVTDFVVIAAQTDVDRVSQGLSPAAPAGPLRPSTMLGAALSEVEGRETGPTTRLAAQTDIGRVAQGLSPAAPAGPLRPSTMLGAALSEVEGRETRPTTRRGDSQAAGDDKDIPPVSIDGVFAALRVVEAARRVGGRLWIVTRGVHEGRDVAQAPLWGLARTLALEEPALWGGIVDFDIGSTSDAAPQTAQRNDVGSASVAQLVAELLAANGEDQAWYRDGVRHVARVRPLPDRPAQPLSASAGAWLITGGLGAFGLATASHLVARGARRIFLVGRRGIRGDGTAATIERLGERGVEVHVLAADVTSRSDMRDVFAAIARTGERLQGVIHAAGVTGYGLLRDVSDRDWEELLRPKVQGAWILHELTRALDVQHFVCYSSMVSVWGARGQGPYVAANTFLDALARYRRAAGLPAVTVNWGPLSGGGMVPPEVAADLARMGVTTTPLADAAAALDELLTGSAAQPIAVPIDWSIFADLYRGRSGTRLFELVATVPPIGTPPIAPVAAVTPDRDVLAGAPPAHRHALLVDQLRLMLASVVSTDAPIDLRAGLFDLGLDSLGAMELRRLIEQRFGVPLPATALFDCGTLDGLGDAVLTRLGLAESEAARERRLPIAAAGALDALSEAELESLLLRKLEEI